MTDSDIKIILSSDSNYEELTAEIFYEEKFIALLNQDEGLDSIKIEFPGPDVQENAVLRKIDLAVFEKALVEAKLKLRANTSPRGGTGHGFRLLWASPTSARTAPAVLCSPPRFEPYPPGCWFPKAQYR